MTPVAVDAELTDEELARYVAARESSAESWRAARRACEQLYRRHARSLLGFLAARVRRSELEDVHQAVWERVWERLPAGAFAGGNWRAWLFRVARNYVIDLSRRQRPESLAADEAVMDSREWTPEYRLIESERQAMLARCLARLTERAAAVVKARLSGEDYTQMCAELGMNVPQAHKVFQRARDQLKACVEAGGS